MVSDCGSGGANYMWQKLASVRSPVHSSNWTAYVLMATNYVNFLSVTGTH